MNKMNKLLYGLYGFYVIGTILGVIAFVLFITKRKQHEQYAKDVGQYSSRGKGNFMGVNPVLMVISCEKNKQNHKAFASKANTFVVIGKPDMAKKYEIKNKNGIKYLYVRTKDIYFSLPAKIIMALEAFLQMPEFSQYSHFYKIDDDCKINWDRIKTGYPIEFKNHIDKNPYSGGVIFKDKGRRWNANRHQKYASQDPTNYWATNNYTGDGINYLRGSNYVLRRDLIKKINKIWNSSSLDVLLRTEVAEDVTIGKACLFLNTPPSKLPSSSIFVVDEFNNE